MDRKISYNLENIEIIVPKLKVCGLSILEQINYLKKESVDFLGFIFYSKSPRYALRKLNIEDILKITHVGENKGKVGVFVNESIDTIVEISKKAGLNYIQLHGDEEYENSYYTDGLKKNLSNVKIIKAIRIAEREDLKRLQEKISIAESFSDFILFDTDTKAYGGAGKSFDWRIIDNMNLKKPYFLSGGISMENISNIRKIKNIPFAIDINSKFEISPGNKNLAEIIKMQKLI